jgi:hypothetical protein
MAAMPPGFDPAPPRDTLVMISLQTGGRLPNIVTGQTLRKVNPGFAWEEHWWPKDSKAGRGDKTGVGAGAVALAPVAKRCYASGTMRVTGRATESASTPRSARMQQIV